jgi:hypothetical protein
MEKWAQSKKEKEKKFKSRAKKVINSLVWINSALIISNTHSEYRLFVSAIFGLSLITRSFPRLFSVEKKELQKIERTSLIVYSSVCCRRYDLIQKFLYNIPTAANR